MPPSFVTNKIKLTRGISIQTFSFPNTTVCSSVCNGITDTQLRNILFWHLDERVAHSIIVIWLTIIDKFMIYFVLFIKGILIVKRKCLYSWFIILEIRFFFRITSKINIKHVSTEVTNKKKFFSLKKKIHGP